MIYVYSGYFWKHRNLLALLGYLHNFSTVLVINIISVLEPNFLYSVLKSSQSPPLGLHFRLSSSKEAIFTITYAGLPGARPSPVDWKMCCTSDSDLPGEHIICYHLTNSENSLPAVVEECCEDESNVVGLIIVNFEKNCFLPDEILKNGIPQAPPIYVVSVEDGEQIFDFISAQVNVGNTQVRVLVESVVDSESAGMSRRPSKGMYK